MQKIINDRLKTATDHKVATFAALLCISSINIQPVFSQGMGGGMMGMGGGGGGMRKNQNNQPQNDRLTPPKHQNPFALDAAAVEGLDARTAALENFIFGSVQKKITNESSC